MRYILALATALGRPSRCQIVYFSLGQRARISMQKNPRYGLKIEQNLGGNLFETFCLRKQSRTALFNFGRPLLLRETVSFVQITPMLQNRTAERVKYEQLCRPSN